MRYVIGLLAIFLVSAAVLLLGLRLAAMLREVAVLPDAIPAEGRLVETEFGTIYVEELGPAEGPALLFIHGSVGWSRMWRPTQEALAAQGYRTIAFDMPPMGYSFRDPKGDFSRKTQASRLLALVRALKVRPVLVAHSFGAGAGAEAAMREPAAFAGLVVVSGDVGLDGHLNGKTLPWPMDNPFAREVAVSATVTNPAATGFLLKRLLHRKEAATEDMLAMLNRPGNRPGTTAAIASWLPSLLVPPKDALSTRPESWQALTLPLAFIWGDMDNAAPLSQGERLAGLAGGPLTVLKDVGHIPQIEAPGDFQQALLATLATLAP